jgi:hypothetical protein
MHVAFDELLTIQLRHGTAKCCVYVGRDIVFSDAFDNLRHDGLAFLMYVFDIHCILVVQFASDREPIVADSCIVALDMLEFENSGEFEYASKA